MTDTSIVRLLLKENFRDIYDALEETGGILYLNNTINRWLLSIFIQGMSEKYTLLIWDMFLLEGNIVLFKTIYALIYILEKHIIKCKNFDELNNVFNEVPLNLNQRANLAYYLISKKFNFNMDLIRKYRKTLSPQIIKEIEGLGTFHRVSDEEEERDEEFESKKIVCDLDWPICLNDKKNLTREFDYIVLKQLNEPTVIDNYFNFKEKNKNKNNNENIYDINNEKDEEKIKYFKEKIYEDLLIERRKHYCNSKLMSIRADLYKSSIKFEKVESDQIKKRKSSLNFFDPNEDESRSIDKRNEAINKIVIDVSNQNQRFLSFVKEDVEKRIKLIEDDKV